MVAKENKETQAHMYASTKKGNMLNRKQSASGSVGQWVERKSVRGEKLKVKKFHKQ